MCRHLKSLILDESYSEVKEFAAADDDRFYQAVARLTCLESLELIDFGLQENGESESLAYNVHVGGWGRGGVHCRSFCDAPEVKFIMSKISGSISETICPRYLRQYVQHIWFAKRWLLLPEPVVFTQ